MHRRPHREPTVISDIANSNGTAEKVRSDGE
jgi:hypothetical protein